MTVPRLWRIMIAWGVLCWVTALVLLILGVTLPAVVFGTVASLTLMALTVGRRDDER